MFQTGPIMELVAVHKLDIIEKENLLEQVEKMVFFSVADLFIIGFLHSCQFLHMATKSFF